MSAKILKLSIIAFLLIVLGGLAYFFLPELEALVGLSSGKNQVADLRGENININAGGKSISVPPKFSEDILDFIKKNLNQTGGLPLKIERKGNPLPFGIP